MTQANDIPTVVPRRTVAAGLEVFALPRASYEEYFITAVPSEKGESPRAVFEKAARALRECNGRIIAQDVFGLPSRDGADLAELRAAFGEVDWPVTWLTNGDGKSMFGTQIWAASPELQLERVRSASRTIGTRYEDEFARHLRLGGIGPQSTVGATREEQAREVFDIMQAALRVDGMDFHKDVLRTWFYNDDILAWYGEFNGVRNDFFTEKGVFRGMVPASTGIGGSNPRGEALVAGLLAAKSKVGDERVKIFPLPSPLQCPALDYGSSFSRAMEFDTPDHRRILVSGTASIEPGGETLYLNDMDGQTDLTMRVVAAILESRGMAWCDVVRSVVYIRNAGDAPAYARYCQSEGLEGLPSVVTNNVVCRDDLLYEIEVDAVKAKG